MGCTYRLFISSADGAFLAQEPFSQIDIHSNSPSAASNDETGLTGKADLKMHILYETPMGLRGDCSTGRLGLLRQAATHTILAKTQMKGRLAERGDRALGFDEPGDDCRRHAPIRSLRWQPGGPSYTRLCMASAKQGNHDCPRHQNFRTLKSGAGCVANATNPVLLERLVVSPKAYCTTYACIFGPIAIGRSPRVWRIRHRTRDSTRDALMFRGAQHVRMAGPCSERLGDIAGTADFQALKRSRSPLR